MSINLHDFLYMDGYYFYVWSSYGLAVVILVWNVLSPMRQKRSLLRRLGKPKRRGRNS